MCDDQNLLNAIDKLNQLNVQARLRVIRAAYTSPARRISLFKAYSDTDPHARRIIAKYLFDSNLGIGIGLMLLLLFFAIFMYYQGFSQNNPYSKAIGCSCFAAIIVTPILLKAYKSYLRFTMFIWHVVLTIIMFIIGMFIIIPQETDLTFALFFLTFASNVAFLLTSINFF